MNLLNLDDKTRIRILKGFLLLTAASSAFCAYGIKLEKRRCKRLHRRNLIASKIIERFTEVVGEEVSDKIIEEFEFDFIVADVE